MPQFGLDGSIQLITSPGICCPLLLVGGLLIGRGHLVSSNVVLVSEQVKSNLASQRNSDCRQLDSGKS